MTDHSVSAAVLEARGCDPEKHSGAEAQPSSTVTRVYRHALESIFAFLTLSELSRILRVSHSWSAAVRPMQSIDATVVGPKKPWWLIAASALVHHVGRIGLPRDPYSKPVLTGQDLFILAHHFGSLTSLSCFVKPRQPRLFFGPSLRALDLTFKQEDAVAINAAIVIISRLPQLADLTLRVPDFFPALSFAPLVSAAQLHHLTLSGLQSHYLPSRVHLALPHLDQLRMLPYLRKVSVPELSKDHLAHLLRPPHSLQWHELRETGAIDDDVARLFSTLPSLTALSAWDCRTVAFLPSLTSLRSLGLISHPDAHLAADIAAGLPSCPQLTALSLIRVDVTSKHLNQALPHLPLLRDFRVHYCFTLESLSFFSECTHLAQSLESLSFQYCCNAALHSSEFNHVLTLKNLTSLSIFRSFAEPLDSCTLDSLKPPSSVLPALKKFFYQHK